MSEDKLKAAESFKGAGNAHFVKGEYSKAIEEYTKAVETAGSGEKQSAVYFSNIAFCHIKMENFGAAIDATEKAKVADKTFAKAYYRKASALFALSRLAEAIKELDYVVKELGVKSNKDINERLAMLRKLKKEQDFLDAIQHEDELDKCKEENLTVEPSYNGPVITRDSPVKLDDVFELLEYLKQQKKLHKKYLWTLLKMAREVLDQEANVVDVAIGGPVEQITVCGDIHGQYYDLLNIFKMNGYPSAHRPYLFNGDFVDRGSFSVECMIALLAFKVAEPGCIYLNRGNHESVELNKLYGFEGEVKAKYCPLTFALFNKVFQVLPLGTRISEKVLVLHGGLFEKEGVKLADLQKIQRRGGIPQKGLMCDMLWADPTGINGRHPSKRGVSIEFGPDVAERFLDDNGLGKLTRPTCTVASGQRRRLRDREGRQGDHGLLRPQILRPDDQQGRVHHIQGGPEAKFQGLRRCGKLSRSIRPLRPCTTPPTPP